MHPPLQANNMNLKHLKSLLLGTSAFVCLALAAPVLAADFTITSGATTNDGNTINGNDSVTVTGALVTTGVNEGIDTTGGTNTISVSEAGSIETAGGGAFGIFNNGGRNATTVSGSIETAGEAAYGIFNSGDGNVTTVSGSITTTGDIARGILTIGDSNQTNFSGSIATTGDNAHGISNFGDNNKTTISGSITTTRDTGHGIFNFGDSNQTTVSGIIKTGGNLAYGIYNRGDDNTTTISGTVSATGTDASALWSTVGSGNSFTLNEGAVIIGDISAGSNSSKNKLKFNLGASSSYAYTVGGAGEGTGSGEWNFTDQDGRTPVVTSINTSNCTAATFGGVSLISACNLVTGVSTGNLEVQDELQFSMNSSMIGSLSLGSSNSAAPAEAMSFAQIPQSSTWVNIYGDTSERSASTAKLAFDGSNRGLTIGTPVAIGDTLNLDVVFNASNADLDIRSSSEQQITAKSYNIGAVLRHLAPSSGWTVDAFGFVGRNSYDGTRKVMNNKKAVGYESVTAAYTGSEVLVGVDAQYSNPINDTLNFIGGLNASLSNEKIGAYSEGKYYSWDARTMTQASGGITAGVEHRKGSLRSFASAGLQRSSLEKGKTATYTNNGTAGSFTDSSTGDTRRSVTVGFDYVSTESMTFSGAVEAFTSTGGVSGNSVNLGANWSF